MRKKIIFVNSHPIQYFAPLYKFMNNKGVETACWYCSDESMKGVVDREFGVKVRWDVPMLEGYCYKFFKNHSPKPSYFNGFFGLINLGMIRELFKIPKSVIVVHGYHYFTLFGILMLGKLRGHTVCLRFELPYNQEKLKTGWRQKLRHLSLKYLLFPRVNFFLYIGEQNRQFYKSYGIADSRLLFCPYAVDNDRFQNDYGHLIKQLPALKYKMEIPPSGKVIIFSAKYIIKKRPLDILKAFSELNNGNTWLIMIGEGELRPEMELFIKTNNLKNVILTGFVNQAKISEYYAIGDVFVMSSGVGETWGLSANEAMNFNLPLLISHLPGCATDLVKPGVNGYIFSTGDVSDLAVKLRQILEGNFLSSTTSSIEIIRQFSFDTIVRNISILAN